MSMDLFFESSWAPSAGVKAAGRLDPRRLADYARWTLRGDFEGFSAAQAVGWKLLTRGTLCRAPASLESALAALFGGRLAEALRCAHRLELALLLRGWPLPERLETDLVSSRGFSYDQARSLEALVLRDLAELWPRLARLYPEAAGPERGPFRFSFDLDASDGWAPEARLSVPDVAPRAARPPHPSDLAYFLKLLFGHEAFRPGQAEAVSALLQGRDAVMLAATGSGKSLVYQLAGLLMPGTALIVEPLLSLIEDQLRHLEADGITTAGGLSGDDRAGTARTLRRLEAGELAFCYAAPERLGSGSFRRAARELAERSGFCLLAIDEAHCASPLGHDFRPAYRRFAARAKRWCAGPGWEPPTAALTGTASPETLVSACAELGLSRPPAAAAQARPELTFRVDVQRGEPRQRLRRLLSEPLGWARFDSGLVFCPHVDGPMGAVEVAEELLWTENREADCYTGRAPRGRKEEDWAGIKTQAARRFLSGEVPLLCCTRAFGLGVHKPDIRYTVHLGLPPSLAAFHQEAGRAGRDGQAAQCWIVLDLRSARRARRWLSGDLEAEDLALEVARQEPDDVSRLLRLHLRRFPGQEAERESCAQALWALGDLDRPRRVSLSLPGQSPSAISGALERLEAAGLLELEEYQRTGPVVQLAGGFCAASAGAALEGELGRVYGELEPARRAAAWDLLERCLDRDPSKALAGGI